MPDAKPAAKTVKHTAKAKIAEPVGKIRPVARPVARGRHRRLMQSFFAFVVVPALLVVAYMALVNTNRDLKHALARLDTPGVGKDAPAGGRSDA